MARSTRVYVASTIPNWEPIAGFTVKHELKTWLLSRREDTPLCIPLLIFSLVDGHFDPMRTKYFTEEEFIAS